MAPPTSELEILPSGGRYDAAQFDSRSSRGNEAPSRPPGFDQSLLTSAATEPTPSISRHHCTDPGCSHPDHHHHHHDPNHTRAFSTWSCETNLPLSLETLRQVASRLPVNATEARRMITIHSSKDYPPHAFVAVPFNNYWFWIDQSDLKSKRAFSFMMGLFTLANTSEKLPLPQVVVPAR